jgi:DNA-binding NarL/FixJ family response regulator
MSREGGPARHMTDTHAPVPTITISILSRQYLVWFGLQKILESCTTVRMVLLPPQCGTADWFFTVNQPDVVILDLETGRDAMGTIELIRKSAPTSKIVLLCGLEDHDCTREIFASGADGIILKVQPPTVMLAVIEALCAAKSQVDGERDGAGKISLGTIIKKKLETETPQPAWPDALTEREREIIRLVGQGLSNKDIAYTLSISDSTVRHHMTNIFDKVGVPNRQKLLIHAHHVRSAPV